MSFGSAPSEATLQADIARTPRTTTQASNEQTLADRQLLVGQRVSRLEDRMFQLSQALQKTEPEKAQRLIEVLGNVRSEMLGNRTREIAEQLQQGSYADAADKQGELSSDMQELLKMLLEEPDQLDELAKEMKRLKEIKAAIGRVIQEQQNELRAAEALKDSKSDEAERANAVKDKADKQNQIADKTEKIADEMKGQDESKDKQNPSTSQQDQESKDGSDSKDNEKKSDDASKDATSQASDEQEEPETTPGQDNVQQAVPLQRDAAKRLKDKKVDEAIEKQKEAVDKLKKAEEDLTARLDQLRKEQQEELLASLESRFRAMLSRQVECNKAVRRLSDIGKPNWKRSDQLELAELSQKQKWVGDEADGALFILKDEGTTVIVPQLVGQVRDDALYAADRLAALDVSKPVLALQEELEQVLRDMVEAIQKKQEELQENQNSQQQAGQQQSQPLLPGSAEMKLLRSCQLRVNQATTRLREGMSDTSLNADQLANEIRRVAKRQEDVAKMARDMQEAMTRAQ